MVIGARTITTTPWRRPKGHLPKMELLLNHLPRKLSQQIAPGLRLNKPNDQLDDGWPESETCNCPALSKRCIEREKEKVDVKE